MFIFTWSLYVENIMPKVIRWEVGPLGGDWAHKGGDLMNGISDLMEESPESSLDPFGMCRPREKSAASNSEEARHYNLTVLAPWSWTCCFQNCEK